MREKKRKKNNNKKAKQHEIIMLKMSRLISQLNRFQFDAELYFFILPSFFIHINEAEHLNCSLYFITRLSKEDGLHNIKLE